MQDLLDSCQGMKHWKPHALALMGIGVLHLGFAAAAAAEDAEEKRCVDVLE